MQGESLASETLSMKILMPFSPSSIHQSVAPWSTRIWPMH